VSRLALLRVLGLGALVCCLACASTQSPSVESAPKEVVSRPAATPDVLRGEQLLVNGQVSEAQTIFEQAIANDPEDARAWLDLGLTHEAKGDFEAAKRAYLRATQIDPRFAEAFNNLGVLLRESGDLEQATSALERAASLDPDLTAARFNLGLTYEEQRRFDEAEREYLATIEQLPGDPVPRINLAMMYLDINRPDDALVQLRSARPAVRGDLLLSIPVGAGFRRAGSPEEAVAVLRQALDDAEPHPPTELVAELALAYYAVDDLPSAEALMRRAIGQNELDPALHYAYGSILAKQGQIGKARRHLRRAAQLDPQGPYGDRARKRLEALK